MNIASTLLPVLGACLTFLLAKHNRFDAIRASASLSIIAYLLLNFLHLDAELNSLLFFGGTFIGMSAAKRFGIFTVLISALLFSLFFKYLVPLLDGYGGALGLSAFLSVCICHIGILLGAPRSKKAG
ncbi:hypothetical protein [Pseudoalteromonas mariniglutinosa]|uniref:hypothetical protein n=1 Tax=Pseudoalteromonas mariniglutinosa TaxID=206042 RepID=UPI00384C5E45